MSRMPSTDPSDPDLLGPGAVEDEDSGRARLTKSARQQWIMTQLAASPSLRAADLAMDLGVSNETIRRDLVELNSRGLLNRTYGGAARPFALEPAMTERMHLLVPERDAIAAAISALVREDEVLMIGAGSTTTHVARHLAANNANITVITHAFSIATALAANPTIRVLFCPGRYHGREGYVFGTQTIANLNSYEANYAIVGATGIGVRGVNDADDEAAAIYRAMALRAARAIVAVDHSKFDQPSLSLVASWDEVDRLVTDTAPPEPLARALERAGVELTIAPVPPTGLRRPPGAPSVAEE